MVCTAKDLQDWKDFPKGLSVLLLEEDATSASQIRSKLIAMDYSVSVFGNEVEALSEFSSKPESFHLAIVEVNENNGDRTFKFLESAKELPIIMTSNVHCISTIMKCIALGAVEFLPKPLSEEKLKNIWQHVVHKAYNSGGPAITKPDNMVQEESNVKMSTKTENFSENQEHDDERSSGTDKYPAPSTPQLKQAERLLDDRDCQEQTNCSTEKESAEQDGESKSVETTCGDSVAEVTDVTDQPEMAATSTIKDEGDTSSRRRIDETSSPQQCDVTAKSGNGGEENAGKASSLANSSLSKSSRKKVKIDWTPELHRKFVHAVEQLSVDQAIPSRILELMKVEGLTRYNVASHLQKYRMHKRHILPKEIDQTLSRPRELMSRNCYAHRPVMAFPTYHSNHSVHAGPVYPMWGHPGGMWAPPAYPLWQPAENWHWQPYPGVHADAWGCPVMPPPHTSYHQPQSTHGICNVPQNSFDLHPAEEVIDKVVKEAISKPWLPLPLGLKPPSTDTVLSELSRQGISPDLPHHHHHHGRS